MSQNANPQRNHANPFRLLLRLPVPWVFVLAYFVGVALEFLFPRGAHFPVVALISRIGGAVLFLGGVALAAWGLVVFRKAHTTTVPGEISSQLVTSGPYRVSRNPMYVGLSLAYVGEAGLLIQVWPLLILPLVVAYLNWIVIPVEEGRLKEAFGDVYEQYRVRVRRWI